MLSIEWSPVAPLHAREGEQVELSSLTFRDTTPASQYAVTIDWGDLTPKDSWMVESSLQGAPIRIRPDYRFDSLGFFDQPGSRGCVQRASNTLSGWIRDDLAAIVPTPQNSFTAITDNPATGQMQSIPALSIGRKEIVVFVGGRDLPGNTLAESAAGTYQATGSPEFLQSVAQARPGRCADH